MVSCDPLPFLDFCFEFWERNRANFKVVEQTFGMPRMLVSCGFKTKKKNQSPVESIMSLLFHTHKHLSLYSCVFFLWCSMYTVIYSFLFSFSTDLIDTYETVTIDVLIPLLISLSSVFFCKSIFVIHTYACANLHIYYPPLTYPRTFIAISKLICMLVSTIL